MNKNITDNTSVSAYRVFETLKFLINKPANVTDIIKHLANLEEDNKAFSKAVIYKYISTLKFAGINIENNKCKYQVTNLPFKIPFSETDINTLYIINLALKYTQETYLTDKLNDFLYQLQIRNCLETTLSEDEINHYREVFLKQTSTDKQLKTLQLYEKYCKDKLKLSITYINTDGEKQKAICSPLFANMEDNNVIFSVFSEHSSEQLELNSKQIIEINQTPSKCSDCVRNQYSTIYKIKGKLSARYTLRNKETILNSEGLDEKTISNKEESKEKLMLRLMRYFDQCKILTPKSDREKMVKLIDKTLSNYNL